VEVCTPTDIPAVGASLGPHILMRDPRTSPNDEVGIWSHRSLRGLQPLSEKCDSSAPLRPQADPAAVMPHVHAPPTFGTPMSAASHQDMHFRMSVFVKKPERIVALALVMVLCLLLYRLAEHRLREQLALRGQTVSNQLSKPTDRPTLRWIFPCFEGISLVGFQLPGGLLVQDVNGLEPSHEQVLALLGPTYEKLYKPE
jgi:hypothetical protein